MIKTKSASAAIKTVLQLSTALALIITEVLSGYRAGVMQHLYYKKFQYMAGFYHNSNLVYHILFMFSCGLTITLFNKYLHKNLTKKTPGRFLFICTLFFIVYSAEILKELNVYAYILFTIEFWIILETLFSAAGYGKRLKKWFLVNLSG